MTPRGRIFSLPANLTLAEASARIVEEQHTRVPVFDPLRGPEHIIGIVHSKDVARIMHFRATALAFRPAGEPARVAGPALRDVMREALFVPETKLAVDLLQEFQERRRLMAIVVDEFGSTSGIVSAEDVLEQIVGELEDEFDIGSEVALASAGGGMMLDGTTPLRDLVTSLGWSFPRRAGIETLAGYVLAELGHLPVAGESVLRGGRRFTASEMMGRRISRVLVEDRTGGASEQATEDDGLEVGA
jgi:putative hemolysin